MQIAAIWAVAIWPALNFTAHNWADVVEDGAGALSGVALISLVLGVLGHLFHSLMSRRNAGSFAVICFVLGICLFFGYSLIHEFTATLLARFELGYTPRLVWLLLLAIFAVAVILLRKQEGLQSAAMVFSFAVAGLALIQLLIAAVNGPHVPNEAPVAASGHPRHAAPNTGGRNVYYILLDGYAGKEGLREFSGFDNSEFLSQMAARGFVDAASIGPETVLSDYLITQQTLGAIFGLDYLLTGDRQTWREPWRLFPNIVDGAQVPPLIRELEAGGYTAWQTFNTWTGCSGRNMRCLGGEGSMSFDYMTMAFVAPTPLGRAVSLWLGRRVDGLTAIGTHLPVMKESNQSFFVFVHSLVTHAPFLLDAACQPRDLSQGDLAFHKHDRDAYVGALKCANSKVLELMDRILSDNPDAIIVIQSDHGSEIKMNWETPLSEWPDSFIRERGSFLNLVKAPGPCAPWLDRSIAQVNTARFVLGCARGRPPEYLPERTYLSSYSKIGGNYVIVPMEERGARKN